MTARERAAFLSAARRIIRKAFRRVGVEMDTFLMAKRRRDAQANDRRPGRVKGRRTRARSL